MIECVCVCACGFVLLLLWKALEFCHILLLDNNRGTTVCLDARRTLHRQRLGKTIGAKHIYEYTMYTLYVNMRVCVCVWLMLMGHIPICSVRLAHARTQTYCVSDFFAVRDEWWMFGRMLRQNIVWTKLFQARWLTVLECYYLRWRLIMQLWKKKQQHIGLIVLIMQFSKGNNYKYKKGTNDSRTGLGQQFSVNYCGNNFPCYIFFCLTTYFCNVWNPIIHI